MAIDLSMQGTQADLAYLVGVTQPAISQMMNAGKIPSAGTLGELVLAYVQHLRRQAALRLGDGLLDITQERARLARSQREGYEIKNMALRCEYAPVPVLGRVLGIASEALAIRFDELERAVAAQLPDLPEAAAGVVRQVIASARAEWVRATAELKSAPVDEAPVDDEDNTLDMETDL